MSTMLEYAYDHLGFNIAFFILGAAGGFVRSITKDKVTARHGAVNIFVGGIIASYFTPILITHFKMVHKESVFATALALGFTAMGIFVVYGHIENWAKRNPKYFVAQFANWLSSIAKGLGAGASKNPTDNDTTNDSAES